jgi:hypothetical protein
MKHIKQLITAGESSGQETSTRFFPPDLVRVVVFTSLSILVVIIVYVWIISSGSWTSSSTIDYAQLVTAFQHGRLSLDSKPRPELLALPNPYNPNERHNIRYPNRFFSISWKVLSLLWAGSGSVPVGGQVSES